MMLMALAWSFAVCLFAFLVLGPLTHRQEWFVRGVILGTGFVGVGLSALFSIGWIRNLLQLRGVVLSIGPRGILDRRISEQLLPWSAITRIQGAGSEGPAIGLGLRIDPRFDSTWPKHFDAKVISLTARIFDRSTRRYPISAVGLQASFKEIEEAVLRHKYFDRWGTSGL
jgi:hypothetical protein